MWSGHINYSTVETSGGWSIHKSLIKMVRLWETAGVKTVSNELKTFFVFDWIISYFAQLKSFLMLI